MFQMKRKSDPSSDNDLAPGKKPCRLDSADDSVFRSHQHAAHTVALLRKKIASKDDPPPNLGEWMQIYKVRIQRRYVIPAECKLWLQLDHKATSTFTFVNDLSRPFHTM